MSGSFILETQDLTTEFRGLTAVQGVDLRVGRGAIYAFIWLDGAGKTLAKFLNADPLEDRPQGTRHHRVRFGATTPRSLLSRLSLFPHLTVLENVRRAIARRRGSSFDFSRSNTKNFHFVFCDDGCDWLLAEGELSVAWNYSQSERANGGE